MDRNDLATDSAANPDAEAFRFPGPPIWPFPSRPSLWLACVLYAAAVSLFLPVHISFLFCALFALLLCVSAFSSPSRPFVLGGRKRLTATP